MISMAQAFKNFWRNYFNFTGTATRAEYWWMTLYLIIFTIFWIPTTIMIIIATPAHHTADFTSFWQIFTHSSLLTMMWILLTISLFIALAIPSLSLHVRRYRDTGLNEIWVWLIFILTIVFNFYSPRDNAYVRILPTVVTVIAFILTILPTEFLSKIKILGRTH